MEKLHNLHYFCINGIARCEFQTKITLCFHAQCTNHSVINQKMRMFNRPYSICIRQITRLLEKVSPPDRGGES